MKTLNATHSSSKERIAGIISAALDCFNELGFNNTSMSDICSRANASTGSVYHHFKSKEQLAAEVYLKGIENYQHGMLRILSMEKDPFRGISSIIDYHIKWIIENPGWAHFLFQSRDPSFFNETEKKLFELNKNFITGITEWFKPHILSGKIRSLSWDLLISLLLGPCQEFTRLFLSGKNAARPSSAVKEISAAVCRSLSNEL